MILDSALFSVITLPVLAPIAALLQLLFPGLLRDQWRQYRVAIYTLLTQSTVLTLHWLVGTYWITGDQWWKSDNVLTAAMVAVAFAGVLWSLVANAVTARRGEAVPAPTRVETLAFGIFALVGAAWALYQIAWQNTAPFDQMLGVTIACVVALLHLQLRKIAARRGTRTSRIFTTEVVFLLTMTVAGAAIGVYAQQTNVNRIAGPVESQWPTYRGGLERHGASGSVGPERPVVLWSCDLKERKGSTRLHSSPTVIDGHVFIGGLYQVQTLIQGNLYCINDRTATNANDPKPGELVWRFNAGGTLKPVFSSPSVADGRVYVGEGYHQNRDCRLFCLDVQHGDKDLWQKPTGSHVESSATIDGDRLYVGAGDDGLLCWDLSSVELEGDTYSPPKTVWRTPGIHVDASPLVAEGRIYVGTVIGDEFKSLQAVAVDANTGNFVWRVDAPLPVAGSPSLGNGRVLFGLGNGKMDFDDEDNPAGAVWSLDAVTGERVWTFDTKGAILNSPVVSKGRVYAACRDQHCYCLDEETGEKLWGTDVGDPLVCTPAVAGNRVYLVTVGGNVACLNAIDGNIVWTLDALATDEQDAYASPVVADGKLYVAIGSKVHCIGDATP